MIRRRLLLLVVPAVTLAGLLAFWLLWPRSAITRANAERIQEGMTLAEVEDILGGPPRDDGVGLIAVQRRDGSEGTIPRSELLGILGQVEGKSWLSDEVLVWITLDHAGRVTSCSVEPVRLASPLDKLRRWLRL
jgi:hypothetical protein